jgi:hypothetical protein
MESCYWIWYALGVHGVIFSIAAKLIGFTTDESASQCIDFADLVSRRHTGSTTVGYTSISATVNKSKQHVSSWADISTTEFGDDDTAQVSYRGSCDQTSSC